MSFIKGDKVQQVVKPIKGEVIGYEVDRETGALLVGVGWSEGEGETLVEHHKYFKAEELEAQPTVE